MLHLIQFVNFVIVLHLLFVDLNYLFELVLLFELALYHELVLALIDGLHLLSQQLLQYDLLHL